MDRRNYYRILEIERSASCAEVKAAYRRLAKRFHPDVTDDPDGERKFKAMAEAYRTLKGRDTRRAYDRRALHVDRCSEDHGPTNPLDLWCALMLWPAWSLFWLR